MKDANTGNIVAPAVTGQTRVWATGYSTRWQAILHWLRAELAAPVMIFTLTRAGLFLAVYLSLAIMPLNTDPAISATGNPPRSFPGNLFVDGWTRWDAGWYANIAESGYSNLVVGPPGQRNLAFFPLYPLSMKIANVVLHNYMLSGIVVSNLAFLLATILLYSMVKRRFDAELAGRTVLLWAVWPLSFYFTAVYADALFCLMVVATFFFGEQKRWWAAGLCALLAGATRLAGVALLPALGLLYLQSIQFDWRKLRPNVLWVALAGMGPLTYALFLTYRFGNPLLYLDAMHAPAWWPEGRGLDFALTLLHQVLTPSSLLVAGFPVSFTFNLLVVIALLLTVALIFWRLGLVEGVFSLLLVAVSLSQWVGMGRYTLAVFPAFIVWARLLKNRLAFECVLVISALLLAFWAIAFSHWFWVT